MVLLGCPFSSWGGPVAGNRLGDMTEVLCLPPDPHAQLTLSSNPQGQGICQAPILPHRSISPAQCVKTSFSILMGATCPYGHEKVDMHLVSIPKGRKHHQPTEVNEEGWISWLWLDVEPTPPYLHMLDLRELELLGEDGGVW